MVVDTVSHISDTRGESANALPTPPVLTATTLPAQIHESLEEAIIVGDIAPGSRLNADQIAAHYGVSRIPVREALRSLHEAGWVDIRPRHGVYVRDRSLTELKELFEARAGIESQLAYLAAQRRTSEDIENMRRIIADREVALGRGDIPALSRATLALSDAVRKAAANGVLAALSYNLEKRARFYFEMVTARYGADWVKIDNSLVELIDTGDADAAAAKSRQHILDTGDEAAALLSNA
jgi:DNA-binding GntR family transcriptional regulator